MMSFREDVERHSGDTLARIAELRHQVYILLFVSPVYAPILEHIDLREAM